MNNLKSELCSLVYHTVERRLKPIREFLKLLAEDRVDRVWIAGSACLPRYPANDIDMFFPEEHEFTKLNNFTVYVTRNARTLVFNKVRIQICNYRKESLEELVESFDFAHIKVGVQLRLKLETSEEEQTKFEISIDDVYISDDAIKAAFARTTWFIGSEYPLSSLIRLFKYSRRCNLTSYEIRKTTVEILGNIIERGFRDYEDLKDQLDAIDIQMVEVSAKTIDQLKLLIREEK